jgi:branched-chain amino acid transport system substrate-binding protein
LSGKTRAKALKGTVRPFDVDTPSRFLTQYRIRHLLLRKRHRRRSDLTGWRGLFAAALVLALPTKDVSSATSPGRLAELRPIVIGVSNVQSGAMSTLGKTLLLGSTAYFSLVNQNGGIYGRKVSIILKDDRYEPDPAVLNTSELIEHDKVLFLFDYVGTSTLTRVLPVLKYYEQDEIVNVAPLTGADPLRTFPYDRYVFNVRASYREETRALVRHLYNKGFRRIAVLGPADVLGKSGELGVSGALAEFGLSIVRRVSYPSDQAFEMPMMAQVNLLRQAGTDAVIAIGKSGPCAAFVRDARLSGWRVPVANVSSVDSAALLQKLRATSEQRGVDLTTNLINSQVLPSPEDVRYPLVRDYRAHNRAESYSAVALEGWLNAAVVTEALCRAGPHPSRKDFIRAMESLHDFDPGLGIKLDFSFDSHQGLHQVWLNQTTNGQWMPVPTP